MSTKKLKTEQCNLEGIKTDILKSLKLFDDKKNCAEEFENRIENYFKRHKDLRLVVEIDSNQLAKDIYDYNFLKSDRYRREIPDNYPVNASNLETQAYDDPPVCDEQYFKDAENVKRKSERDLQELISNLKKLSLNSGLEFQIR